MPCVKDIGLWGPKIQRAYADLGVLDAAKADLEALMRDDEEIAEQMDEQKYAAELAARAAEVDAAVTGGQRELAGQSRRPVGRPQSRQLGLPGRRGGWSDGKYGSPGQPAPFRTRGRPAQERPAAQHAERRLAAENSAEHSWHLALMAVVLGEHAPPGTDLGKVSTMVVLHDLVEIDAGDLYVYADEAAQRRQAVAERAAADRLFGLLPPEQGSALRALWDEFEQRITPEARFARALDRLQPLIANYVAGGKTWQANGITADQVLERVRLIEDGSAELGQYARNLVSDAVRRGILLPAPA